MISSSTITTIKSGLLAGSYLDRSVRRGETRCLCQKIVSGSAKDVRDGTDMCSLSGGAEVI